jgi:hypothetical protein
VLVAMRDDPDKVMINDLLFDTNPKNEYYRQKLIELGHICYEVLVRESIKYGCEYYYH